MHTKNDFFQSSRGGKIDTFCTDIKKKHLGSQVRSSFRCPFNEIPSLIAAWKWKKKFKNGTERPRYVQEIGTEK